MNWEIVLQTAHDSVNYAVLLARSTTDTVRDWSVILMTLLLLYAATRLVMWLHQLLFKPLNHVRPLSSIGYIPYDGDTHENLVRRVRENRVAGDLPPIYPNGWYGLMESFQVQRGEAKPFHFCGQNVAIFRDESGQAHVLDAYCPHLGAHLAAGGRVVGNCLECPFHGWQFDGTTGKCTHIPYSDRIPEQAKVRSWNVCERNNWIFAWYDAEERDPQWEIPEVMGIASGELTYRGRTEQFMNGHIEEVPLNGADVVHLNVVHGAFIGGGIDLKTMRSHFKPLEHRWTAAWKQSEEPDEKHIGILSLTHAILAFGRTVPLSDYAFSVRQIGPAIVTLEFDLPLGRAVFLQCIQPVEPLVQRIVHNIYAVRTVPTFIAKLVMKAEALQVERDLMIWNNKQFKRQPLLVKSMEDNLLLKHRRWYSQFYSENSPRLVVQPRVTYGNAKCDDQKASCKSQSPKTLCDDRIDSAIPRVGNGNGNGNGNGHHDLNDW